MKVPTERNDLVTYAGTMVLGWILGAVMVVAYIGQPSDLDLGNDKPVNSPSWTTHQDAARELCGGPVVEAGPKVFATHVVVMKLNGLLVRMPTGEAWDRAESKSRADDIWTIAVCAVDVRPAPEDTNRKA